MFFYWRKKTRNVFFESKPKTRMCLEFKIKNAYVFLDGRKKRGCVLEVGLKKRVCVFFQIKKQNRVCFSHTVICDSCLVTSVGCGVSGSQYSCCALRCLFGLLQMDSSSLPPSETVEDSQIVTASNGFVPADMQREKHAIKTGFRTIRLAKQSNNELLTSIPQCVWKKLNKVIKKVAT